MGNPKKIPYLDHTKCYGCKCCLFDCPVNAFDLIHPITKRGMRRTLPEFVRKEDCIGCGVCAKACPFDVIEMIPNPDYKAPAKKAAPAAAEGAAAAGAAGAAAAAAGPVAATAATAEFDPDQPVKIFKDNCKGCTMCAKACPAGAIEGEVKQPHEINQDECIRCGACFETCKFNAIYQGDVTPAPAAPKKAAPADGAKAAAPAAAAAGAAAAKPATPKKKPAPKKVEHAPLNRDFPLRIDPNACKACTMCARNCPEQCIVGAPKTPHVINEDLCSRCGTCWDVCKFNAIYNSDDPVPAYTGA